MPSQARLAFQIKTGKSVPVTQGLKSTKGNDLHRWRWRSTPRDRDSGMIAVRPDTVFRVDEYKAEGDTADKIFMSLLRGSIRSITGWIGKHNASGYRITTPTATIGIRGTDHETSVREKAMETKPELTIMFMKVRR